MTRARRARRATAGWCEGYSPSSSGGAPCRPPGVGGAEWSPTAIPWRGRPPEMTRGPGKPAATAVVAHATLKSLGISLRSATEPIDDTSTGKLMEGVLAAFAQFDNDVCSDRTRAGMKAALELGRWVFLAPIG